MNDAAKPKPKSLTDQFYENPTPAGAVALAIGDHLAAHKFPMWEYVGELRKAEKQARAYQRLVDAIREDLRGYLGDFPPDHSATKLRDLLRDLGEPTS